MNRTAPIGVFDSGLGGLTVLEEIRALCPHENLIYITDSGYAPYGNKPDAFIIQRAMVLAEFLAQSHGVKALVVACNTATAAAISELRQRFDIPVIGMEPGIKPAVEMTESGVIGVLATENTLKSDKFSTLLDVHHHRARILTQPCHGLVEAIECGELASAETMALVASYVEPMLKDGADTIVLGCTHYPLLIPVIRDIAGDRIQLVSTGAAVARQLKNKLDAAGLSNPGSDAGKELYFTSGDAKHIKALVAQIFGREVGIKRLPGKLLPAAGTEIITFELAAEYQLLFQAMLQGEDGLGFVRCVDGVQQLWTTSGQVAEVDDWLKCLPAHFNIRILDRYTWQAEGAKG